MSEKLLMQILEKIGGIEEEIKGVNIRLDRIESRLDRVETRIDKIETKLNGVAEQTALLSEYHTETMNKLDQFVTKEDIAYFDQKLGEHDRDIYKLKINVLK